MYAFFSEKRIDLSNEDIQNIQYLYGLPPSPSLPSSPSSPSLPSSPSSPSLPSSTPPTQIPSSASPPVIPCISNNSKTLNPFDLCKVKYPDHMLLTNNNHLYIFHRELVWVLRLGENEDRQQFTKPRNIHEYLPGIKFSYIYQRTSGEIVIIHNDSFSMLNFPSLQPINGWTNVSISKKLFIPTTSKINAIFNTCTSQTFIFYDNRFYREINECNYQVINQGLIAERFPGIPLDITNAFRYNNGNIYFLKGDTFYEFNEFYRKVIRAGKFSWPVFEINCPSTTILNQLKILLDSLSSYLIE
jgi:hypothetical protein